MSTRRVGRHLVLAAALVAAPALAHHGFGLFQMEKFADWSGTLTKFDLVNPHSYLWFDTVGVDGKPPAEPHGPVELAPGNHTITLACNGANTPHTLKFAAGEVYQFLARQLPGKGCVATLARVRATNP